MNNIGPTKQPAFTQSTSVDTKPTEVNLSKPSSTDLPKPADVNHINTPHKNPPVDVKVRKLVIKQIVKNITGLADPAPNVLAEVQKIMALAFVANLPKKH